MLEATSHVPLRRTKIIATLGPATDDPAVLRELIKAGTDVVRVNFSHGAAEQQAQRIERVRQMAADVGAQESRRFHGKIL